MGLTILYVDVCTYTPLWAICTPSNLLEHADGMSLGVEHERILAGVADLPRLICCGQSHSSSLGAAHTFGERQVTVFQKLGEEEALLVVDAGSAARGIHVLEARETGRSAAVLVDGLKRGPDPFTVLVWLEPGRD